MKIVDYTEILYKDLEDVVNNVKILNFKLDDILILFGDFYSKWLNFEDFDLIDFSKIQALLNECFDINKTTLLKFIGDDV